MRPTDLKFRHPRERTPDPYDVVLTCSGGALLQRKGKKKTSFSTAKRFCEAGNDKTSFWRGPGSYEMTYQTIGNRKLRGTPVYRPFHGNKDVTSNSYFYVGNCMVFKPNVSLMGRKKGIRAAVSSSLIGKSRPTTASSRNYSVMKKFSPNGVDDSPIRPNSALDYHTKKPSTSKL